VEAHTPILRVEIIESTTSAMAGIFAILLLTKSIHAVNTNFHPASVQSESTGFKIENAVYALGTKRPAQKYARNI
jgi:hypothetical protein